MNTLQLLWNDLSHHVSITMESLTTACAISESYEPNYSKLSQWVSNTERELCILSNISPDTCPVNEIQIKVDVSLTLCITSLMTTTACF